MGDSEMVGVPAPKEGRATLDDVARAAGVSRSSASVVLHATKSGTRVSATTRQSVLDAARTLDYRPNALARSLRSSRTRTIGAFYGFDPILAKGPFLLEIVSGLQIACSELGLDLLLHTAPRPGTEADAVRELSDGRADGLVLAAWGEDLLAARVVATRMPAVALVEPIRGMPTVTADGVGGARLQIRHLAERGHRRALVLLPSSSPDSVETRHATLVEEAPALGVCLDVRRTLPSDVTVLHPVPDEDLARLGRAGGPTAVVAWEDETAHRACAQIVAAGLRIPDDVAVVGFNGTKIWYPTRFDLTTVAADWAGVARAAVHRLARTIAGDAGNATETQPVRLHVGSTT